MPDIYYGQLQGVARQKAISIAGITSLDQIQSAKDSLDANIAKGGSFNQWQKEQAVIDLGLPKHRLDNIYRTNLQTSYMAGKWEQFNNPMSGMRYLMYDAINDSRVRPAHLALDGIIRAKSDPFWATHSPPCGFRCRCLLISLSDKQARDRSVNGKGLNQQPILENGQAANPDKGWDYDKTNRMAGVEKAIADRLSKAQPVLKSALENKLKNSLNMKIITLEQFAPVQKAISELAIKNPHWFPEGFNGIYAVERADVFAATIDGAIYFSVADELASGFKPAIDLASALEKITTSSKQKRSFNEEYAVETLWHEISHIIYKHHELPKKISLRSATEGIVQFTARHSYHRLLIELGALPSHQKAIIDGGYAYSVEVSNFRTLLGILELSEEDVARYTDRILNETDDTNLLVERVSIKLAHLTGFTSERIAYALKILSKESGFKQKVINKLNY